MHQLMRTVVIVLLTILTAVSFPSLARSVFADDVDSAPTATPEAFAPVKFSIRPNEGDNEAYFDNVEVSPGETIKLEAALDNWGAGPVNLDIYAVNATVASNGGFVAGLQDETLHSHAKWIKLSTGFVSIEPNTTKIVSFTITVPRDANPGQYISGIVASTTESMPMPGDDNIGHIIRYSMAVSVLVPGELHYDFALGEPVIDEEALTIPITNTGNYLIRPRGNVELKDSEGGVILTAPLQLGSIYSGLSTDIYISLPVQLPEGDYILDAMFEDPESGANSSLLGVELTLEETAPADYRILQATVEPSHEDIVFANIDVTVENSGDHLPATNALLQVYRDGEIVEEFPIATNQVLLRGTNSYQTRYIPVDGWEPGTYTFGLSLIAVDTTGGQEIELVNEELDAEIVVP